VVAAAVGHHVAVGGRTGTPSGAAGMPAARPAASATRGGRTTEIHALCDEQGRSHAILLTGGSVADIAAAVISNTSSRKVPLPHDTKRHRLRDIIERACCRIRDLRGTATRYDKTTRNFLAAVCLVSAITY
jgi:hypothetical protein